MDQRCKLLKALVVLFVLVLAGWGCNEATRSPILDDLNKRLSKLEPVSLRFDARTLPAPHRELLKLLVDATALTHEAFLHQLYPPGVALRDSLAKLHDEVGTKLHQLVVRNGGPFDKMDGYANFVDSVKHPLGAGVYPPDLTKAEFESYVFGHPSQAVQLTNPFTVVRKHGDSLVAVPYHVEFEPWIRPVADLLNKASAIAGTPQLTKYLRSRADALLMDEYFHVDSTWIDFSSPWLEFYIAPYEVYEDHLIGIKTFYEGSVGIVDTVESKRLLQYVDHLDELEHNLPYDDKYKRRIKGLASRMVVVNEIARGGVLATGYQAVATNLPNDPKVQTLKGTKKVFWKNMMSARVEKVIEPVARALLASDQIRYVTPEACFNLVVLHELCHALGPKYVYGTNDTLPVNGALKELGSGIEEGKATVAGVHSITFLVRKGLIPREEEKSHYVSFLAGIFRTIRFGTSEPHAKASLCELNFIRDRGGFRMDPVTKKWSVNFERIEPAVEELARQWLTIEATGDYARADEFFRQWLPMPKDVADALQGLDHIPVDILPSYTIQWE